MTVDKYFWLEGTFSKMMRSLRPALSFRRLFSLNAASIQFLLLIVDRTAQPKTLEFSESEMTSALESFQQPDITFEIILCHYVFVQIWYRRLDTIKSVIISGKDTVCFGKIVAEAKIIEKYHVFPGMQNTV